VSIKLFIKVGSKDESEDKGGITQLAQTLLLKGTKGRSAEEIALEIESVGGSISSDSTEDYSEISVSVTNKHFEKAVEVLSDVFLNPVFPEGELEKEKVVTIAAIKSRQDRIFNVALDLLMENLYGSHPYARLPIGTEETVKNISRKDIINWHKKFYGTPNIVIVVVGNVSLNDTKKHTNKYFSNVPAVLESKISFEKLPLTETKVVTETKKFKQAYLMFGYLVPQVKSEYYAVLKVLNTYLGRGMSSKLFQTIREEAGLCYEISSFYPSRLDTSRFVIYMGLDKSTLDDAKKKVVQLLDEIRQIPVTNEKLNEVKEYIKGTHLLEHQSNGRQAWYLGWWEILGKGYEYDNKYISDLNSVTPEDILKVARKYLKGNHVIIQVVPEK
jgi:predicted Zn-dependent peptidase